MNRQWGDFSKEMVVDLYRQEKYSDQAGQSADLPILKEVRLLPGAGLVP